MDSAHIPLIAWVSNRYAGLSTTPISTVSPGKRPLLSLSAVGETTLRK